MFRDRGFDLCLILFSSGLGYYMHYYKDFYAYGKSTRLISKTLPASNQACLSFWFQMLSILNYPSYRHALRVVLKNSNQETIVWIQSRSHGNRWLQGSVTVTNQYQFQVVRFFRPLH